MQQSVNVKKKFTLSTLFKEAKPVKNLQEELDKRNPLYQNPTYIKIMKERGHMK